MAWAAVRSKVVILVLVDSLSVVVSIVCVYIGGGGGGVRGCLFCEQRLSARRIQEIWKGDAYV